MERPESELPFSHKSVVSITHEQKNICSKDSRSCGGLLANGKEGKNTLNDNRLF